MAKLTKPKDLSYFDVMQYMVNKQYHTLSKTERTKNFFMFNRWMSIKYPTQANFINHRNVNTEKSMDFWNIFISRQMNSVPNWFYTKAIKSKTDEKSWYPKNQEILTKYLQYKEMPSKTFNQYIKDFPKVIREDFESFEKGIS